MISYRNHLTINLQVRDVYCRGCENKLGWMYEFATAEEQVIFSSTDGGNSTFVGHFSHTSICSNTKKAKQFSKRLLFLSVMGLSTIISIRFKFNVKLVHNSLAYLHNDHPIEMRHSLALVK